MPKPLPFAPEQLGEYIGRLYRKDSKRHFVTFLIGAGFSKSAGIPMASEIVSELRAESAEHPLLRDAGPPPDGVSEYAFLMEQLRSPRERADRVKGYVDRARDDQRRLKINWSHFLLATLVEKGYVNRLLTTNFDPLIVEALALAGQPIRTFDLNATGKYHPGTLDPGTVIHLHGQMHSLFLANSRHEMEPLRNLYPMVLQEAVQNSLLIVVGYSGNCDPVLESLETMTSPHYGLWWSQYEGESSPMADGVDKLFQKHGTNFNLACGHDADSFMARLVLDGLKEDLPKEVLKPLHSMRAMLGRIAPFPREASQTSDPVRTAIVLLEEAERRMSEPQQPKATAAAAGNTSSAAVAPQPSDELDKVLQLEMAAMKGDWQGFSNLRQSIQPNPLSRVSQAVGDGLVRQASSAREFNPTGAITLLEEAAAFGFTDVMQPWNLIVWGDVLFEQAKRTESKPEATRLLEEAARKYAEAIRIKPDKHDAFNNWGNALDEQARRTESSPEAIRLWEEAARKYAEAIRIKPDKHEAFNNWGAVLIEQAKRTESRPEAIRLWEEAARKCAEAIRIKPDYHLAIDNWGVSLTLQAQKSESKPEADRIFEDARRKYEEAIRIKPDYANAHFNLGCLAALQGEMAGALVHLERWKTLDPSASKAKLDKDSDFDRIRSDPGFLSFRETLRD